MKRKNQDPDCLEFGSFYYFFEFILTDKRGYNQKYGDGRFIVQNRQKVK